MKITENGNRQWKVMSTQEMANYRASVEKLRSD